MKTYISIDRDRIESNRIDGLDLPVIYVEEEGPGLTLMPGWCRRVEISGPSQVIYDPDYDDNGHRGGAWIETEAQVSRW